MKSSLACSRVIELAVLVAGSLAAVSSATAAPAPLHAFDFDGGYVDSITGTVTLTAEGGSLMGSRHEFDPQQPASGSPPSLTGPHNQGLTLSNHDLSNPGVYSIEMFVRYDTINSISNVAPDWLKLIDFKDGGESLGVYYVDSVRSPRSGGAPPDVSSSLRFAYAPTLGPPLYEDSLPAMTPGDWVHLVLTRAASNEAIAYVNGDFAFTVDDSLLHGVFDGPDNVMRFFQGDLPAIADPTGPYYEVGKGGVDFLNIYDEVLSATDVAELAAAVIPEPSTGALVFCLALLTPAVRRRRLARQ
jgi:hypothetical protein